MKDSEMENSAKNKASIKKSIWIDLDNSPHVVFFKPIIEELEKRGYKVVLSARDCFQVCGLADLYKLKYKRIGRHYGKNKLLKVAGTVLRSLKLMPFVLKEKPALALSHGSRAQLITAKAFGINSVVMFDYEHAKGLIVIHPTWLIAPEVISSKENSYAEKHLLRYPGIKEDVYVPEFKPDPSIRHDLGISEKDIMVTIRPPATEAHYHNPESEELFKAVIEFISKFPNVQIVVLPRSEKQRIEIQETWKDYKLIIPEVVVDGLNLIYNSDLVISGGGTMNREAAALGVPVYSIFRGKIGAVDKFLSDNSRLTLLEDVGEVQTKIKLAKRDIMRNSVHSNNNTLKVIVKHIISIMGDETPEDSSL